MSDAKADIVGVFGRAASVYDEVEPRHFSRFGRSLVERAELPGGAEILDVASGKGAALFPAAERAKRVVGIDLAAPMVEVLRVEIERRSESATAIVMDAENLEFEDESFDAVLCGFAIFMFPDARRALAEFRRVLRPCGVVGLSIFGDGDKRWDATRDRLFANVPQPQSLPSGPPRVPFRNADDLRKALAASGFIDVRIQHEVFDASYADGDHWLEWASSTGYRGAIERLSEQELMDFKREAYPGMEAAREPDGLLHNRLTAIFGYAVKR